MTNKRYITISGELFFPLQKGQPAVIASGGKLIQTSRVLEIMENTEEISLFETLHSIYQVSMLPISCVCTVSGQMARSA